MKAGIICFSQYGEELAGRVAKILKSWPVEAEVHRCARGEFRSLVNSLFVSNDLLVFIGSCGLTVRGIAPLLQGKDKDPAVLVIDEKGEFVISLLSGHLGGANETTGKLAEALSAQAVITTSTDVHQVFSIDDWCRREGYKIANLDKIVAVSSKLLAGEEVSVLSEFPISSELPAGLRLSHSKEKADIVIQISADYPKSALAIIVPAVSLGIGCRKNTEKERISTAVEACLEEENVHPLAIARMASIDLKANEPALLAYAEENELPFLTFPASELQKVEGDFSSSDFVKSVTGLDNVCERASLIKIEGAQQISRKKVYEGVTLALAKIPQEIDFNT